LTHPRLQEICNKCMYGRLWIQVFILTCSNLF